MRRPLLIALAALFGLALTPLAFAAAAPPSAPPALIGTPTVTATGVAVIPPPDEPVSVVTVQLQGPIDEKSSLTFDAYMAKLARIRTAVLAAGVPEASATAARGWTSPNGAGGIVNFNSVFRYEVKSGQVAVTAAQAAFGAGASMVYDNMPAPAVGVRRPESAALDKAVTEAIAVARDYAGRAVRGRTVGDPLTTALTLKGEPDNAPTQWRVEVTITFDVR